MLTWIPRTGMMHYFLCISEFVPFCLRTYITDWFKWRTLQVWYFWWRLMCGLWFRLLQWTVWQRTSRACRSHQSCSSSYYSDFQEYWLGSARSYSDHMFLCTTFSVYDCCFTYALQMRLLLRMTSVLRVMSAIWPLLFRRGSCHRVWCRNER
jgi:hypothetical protein